MPTFEITFPEGKKYRVTAPEGATQAQVLAYVQQNAGAPAPKADEPAPAPDRSFWEQAQRQTGLTARYGLEGPLQLANTMIGDPAATAVNYAIRGINALTVQHGIPELGMPSQATTRMLDRAFPKPEGGAEEVVGAISRGMTGGGPVTAAALRAPAAIASLPMVKSIAGAPVVDLLSQGVGGGASELAKQADLGPAWQMAAGVAAPMALGAGTQGVKMAAQAVNELRRPLTRAGADQIAADVIGRLTQDKTRALENLNRYNTLVARGEQVGTPGVKPTSAAVAGDYGLAGGQQLLARGDANPLFAERMAANNEAMATDLGRLNATEKALEFYKNKREDITAPLREAALGPTVVDGIEVTNHVNFTPVAERIGAIAATAAGGKAESQKALAWIMQRLEKYQNESRTDPKNAYALYQDIGDLVAGKVTDTNGAALRLAGGLANDVKRELGNQIEAAAPGFKKYLEHYSRLSKPIDRLETIAKRLGDQDLTKVTNAMPQVTSNGATFTLSQNKVRNALDAINGETQLTPRQRDVLERVLGDLNAETFASRAGKQPGSDTYQNLASANFLSRILGESAAGSGIGKAVAGPLNIAFRPLEARINDAVAQAFLDPKKMEELLRKARTSRGGLLSLTGIQDFAAPRVSGGLLGTLAQ